MTERFFVRIHDSNSGNSSIDLLNSISGSNDQMATAPHRESYELRQPPGPCVSTAEPLLNVSSILGRTFRLSRFDRQLRLQIPAILRACNTTMHDKQPEPANATAEQITWANYSVFRPARLSNDRPASSRDCFVACE